MLTNKSRRFSRYKRSDITAYFREKGKNKAYIELLNISQQGLAFKINSNIKPKKHFEIIIQFNKGPEFKLKGYIVYKLNSQIKEKSQFIEKVWGVFMTDNSTYNYGFCFAEANNDFQLFLLKSNIQKKLSHRRRTGSEIVLENKSNMSSLV